MLILDNFNSLSLLQNLDKVENTFFIIEKAKETLLDFLNGTVKVL